MGFELCFALLFEMLVVMCCIVKCGCGDGGGSSGGGGVEVVLVVGVVLWLKSSWKLLELESNVSPCCKSLSIRIRNSFGQNHRKTVDFGHLKPCVTPSAVRRLFELVKSGIRNKYEHKPNVFRTSLECHIYEHLKEAGKFNCLN